MSQFSEREQTAYEAELREQFEDNDFEEIPFQVNGDYFSAILIGGNTDIYGDVGEHVVSLYNMEIDDTTVLEAIVRAYNAGYERGESDGRYAAKKEIRKVLGV